MTRRAYEWAKGLALVATWVVLLPAAVLLAGCMSGPPNLHIYNAIGEPLDVHIEVRQDGVMMREYTFTASVGQTILAEPLDLRGTLEFVAQTNRGNATKTFEVSDGTGTISLAIYRDRLVWGVAHADP